MNRVQDSGGADADPDLVDLIAGVVSSTSAPVYVGFSGGLDSTALLHAAVQVAVRSKQPRPVAVHVHHGLQASADAWLEHCERVTQALGVELVARRVTVATDGSLESAARAARYAVFRELLVAPGTPLLLAHHRDDQIETVLMRTLQGRGAYGMPAERRLGAGRILRPWLDVSRAALLRYAQRHELIWVEDPSNAIPDADRNFLRQEILPRLRSRFPQTDRALLALAESLGSVTGEASVSDRLPLAALDAAGDTARAVRLRQWLLDLGQPAPRGRALREFIEQLGSEPDRQPVLELAGGQVRRYQDQVWFVPPPPALAPCYEVPADGRLELPHGVLEVRRDRAGILALPPFRVFFRKGGETIEIKGFKREIKALFQGANVPPWARNSWPLVHDALGLCCVPGVAARDGAPIEAGERVRIEWFPRVMAQTGAGGFPRFH